MIKYNFLEVIERNNIKFGIYLMDNALDNEVELFFKSFYSSFGFRPQFDRKWFDWFYRDNPLGSCNNYILIDLALNKWIGGFGFAKVNYIFQGQLKNGGLGINGFINSGYEGMGLYTDLIKCGLKNESYVKNFAFSYPHRQNIASQKGHFKSGWKDFVRMSFLEIDLKKNEINLSREMGIYENTDLFKKFDFTKLMHNNEFSFSRTYEHLNWRFFNRPDKKYTLLAIETGIYYGYMILGYYKMTNGFIRCHIADYQYSHQSVLITLIERARYIAKEKECRKLDVLINMASEAVQVFTNKKFMPRNEGYNLMIYSDVQMELPLACHLTYGDFDVV